MQFHPVRITSLDANSSTPSGQGDLVNMHLHITGPPSGWPSAFNQLWEGHMYMKKRRAYATTEHIIITCMPDELQSAHIPELKMVVEEANEMVRKATAERDKNTQARVAKEIEHNEAMKNLADDLKI